MTYEALIEKIRKAESLAELKNLVGPSQEEIAISSMRVTRMNEIWSENQPTYGFSTDDWPAEKAKEFEQLNLEQEFYKSTYGIK